MKFGLCLSSYWKTFFPSKLKVLIFLKALSHIGRRTYKHYISFIFLSLKRCLCT